MPDSTGTPSPFYVGVDPASHAVGLAAIDEAGHILTATLDVKMLPPSERADPARRYACLRRQARVWLGALEDVGTFCCVVEQPTTRHASPVLLGAFGVLLEAARSSLACPVVAWQPAAIDAEAGMVRRAGENRKAACMRTALDAWWPGGSQDEADAMVCALAARSLMLRQDNGEDVAA